mmetsp:Transcript_12973/g.40280  ORF Transcript_12973/g.40280 Transcript_12973/m.40280 type:complete len:206 (-) Transcript_12973:20-637(-)
MVRRVARTDNAAIVVGARRRRVGDVRSACVQRVSGGCRGAGHDRGKSRVADRAVLHRAARGRRRAGPWRVGRRCRARGFGCRRRRRQRRALQLRRQQRRVAGGCRCGASRLGGPRHGRRCRPAAVDVVGVRDGDRAARARRCHRGGVGRACLVRAHAAGGKIRRGTAGGPPGAQPRRTRAPPGGEACRASGEGGRDGGSGFCRFL